VSPQDAGERIGQVPSYAPENKKAG
jgi:hypothetical protein